MMLAVVLCCTICIQAQENKNYTTTITPQPLTTEHLLNDSNLYSLNSKLWTGEGVHAGQQRASIKVNIKRNGIPEQPENSLMEFFVTDAYGKVAAINRDTQFLLNAFEDLQFTSQFNSIYHTPLDLKCGGEYTYHIAIPGLDFQYEEKVVVKDEPYVRVRYNDVKAGSDIQAIIFFNTGYPYDPTSLSGTEEATMQLFYLDKNEQGETTETEVAKVDGTFFRNQAGPLMACYDSLKLGYANPKPGEYRLKLSSNWQQEGANRDDIIIKVEAPTAIRSARRNIQENMEEAVYTLDGIRVDTSKPLPRNIYIRKGKKINLN